MLPAPNRLRKNRDFRIIYAKGRSHVHSLAVLYVLKRRRTVPDSETLASATRIGFVVSKKQGKAVARNRIRRRLREAIRLNAPEGFRRDYDLIFVGRSGLKTAPWSEILAAVSELLRRGGVLVKPEFEKTESTEKTETKPDAVGEPAA